MNCHAAHRLLSAERDGTLATRERADLDSHLAECGDCRRARANIGAAIDGWRTSTAAIATPDVERAWHDIRREIRGAGSEKGHPAWGISRWAVPLAAAAAIAIGAVTVPRFLTNPDTTASTATVAKLEKARADFVEVPNNASSMVYVDDKSGWLVVWAVNDTDKL